MKKKLIWQVYPLFLLVVLLSLAAVTWYSSYTLRPFFENQIRDKLHTLANIISAQVKPLVISRDAAAVDSLSKRLASEGPESFRITVMLPLGRVLGDSDEEPELMENHADRPEVVDAIEEGMGRSVRFSNTLNKNMMYVAVPLHEDGELVGVVRTSTPVTAIDRALGDIYVKIFWAGLAILLAAAGLSLYLSRRIVRPVVAMDRTAQEFAKGELDLRVPEPSTTELAQLAETLNRMAGQLHSRIRMVTDQRNQLEAVLSSMVEGVLAIDVSGRIVSINRAAASLLQLQTEDLQGRNIEEVVRNVDLQDFLRRTLESEEPQEGQLQLQTDKGQRFFQLHGASIADSAGGRLGAVVVLNDMTHMRRLENIRRDFVANVSHELRTPVTSIQGFVEALLEGEEAASEQTKRYLQIVAKHSNRLNAIIEDLLSLSRLEEEHETRRLYFEETKLKPVLESAVQMSGPLAAEKDIEIKLNCDDRIEAKINGPLIEQAIINLVSNAVKHSGPGTEVIVSAAENGDRISISVQDCGSGIPKEDHQRIFERFYVVDKSRSRKLGGTGLGLAIVKHIALAHGGRVTLKSSPGTGSTFTIHLQRR